MTKDKLVTDALAEQMAVLRNSYVSRLPAELEALKLLVTGLNGTELDRASLDELHHKFHKLAGSGGTFGLSLLSVSARKLENKIKNLLASTLDEFDEKARASLLSEVDALSKLIEKIDVAGNAFVQDHGSSSPAQAYNIWLVEDDVALGNELVRQLAFFNYKVKAFTTIALAEEAAKTEFPDMLIMDVMFENERENSTEIISQRPHLRGLHCPLLFISTADDFQSRIRAARLGALGYILKPLDVPRLVNRMVQIFEQRRAPPQRVLIVDDDVDLAALYRLALLSAGMEAEVLSDPRDIIEKISAFRPELVLMDLHMPEFSGPELSGVIRQYEKWSSLPIVYLSAETDFDRQIEALDRGGDDFLTKPISNSHLIAAVRVRIERARYLEGQISKDSLTGLLKHASIKEAIHFEVIRAKRTGKPVTIAMLDIDHFKSVNDTYGHAMGDVVISAVAMLLRQRLRQSDIIGRYGGEEFAVALPECDAQTAHGLLDDLRQRFSSVHFSHEGKEFNCAISVGLACTAQYPDSTGAELLVAADGALYTAKRGGRNQVRISSADDVREAKK